MRLLRRILITVVVTLVVIFVGVYLTGVALSFYAARKAPPASRIVPTDLKDKSVSEAPGTKLSYFGYEFEVPWSDLDKTQTKLYPRDKPEKARVAFVFRSGLRLIVTTIDPRSWGDYFVTKLKIPTQNIAAWMKSDYSFDNYLLQFTPEKMHRWALSPRVHAWEGYCLLTKSNMPPKSAKTGIFNVQNQSYKGFQYGNPQVRPDGIVVHFYSDEGSVEMIFSQKDYKSSAGVTQPEINRIVQSLRKTPQNESTAPRIAQN